MNLIFLPGASGSTEFWQAVMQQLPNEYTKSVIAYPSFGGYPAHLQVNSFTDLQTWVINQIDQPSIVIAQSMGGIFAVQAALQKPELIQALVLVATSGGIDLSAFDVADWRKEYQQTFAVPDWFIGHQQALDHQLYKIDCPVLLIWGGDDPISPITIGEYLQSKITQTELHIIENGQHDLAKVYADQVSTRIQIFLQQKVL